MKLLKNLFGRILIIASICVIGGFLSYMSDKLLLSSTFIKPGQRYLYNNDLSHTIPLFTIPIVVIYLGWRIFLGLINYGLHQRLFMSVRIFPKIVLTLLSFCITILIFAAMAGGLGHSSHVYKNLIIFFIASLSIPLLEYRFNLWSY